MAKTTIIEAEPSYTIPEFCAAERISEPYYYKLRAEGRGPKEMRSGERCVRISHRARLEYQKRLEAEDASEQKAKASAKGKAAVARTARCAQDLT